MSGELSSDELSAKIKLLEGVRREKAEVEAAIRAAAIIEAKALIAAHKLTPADLFGKTKSDADRSYWARPKYLNQRTGEQWSGRGRMPRWLVREIANGRAPEEFLTRE